MHERKLSDLERKVLTIIRNDIHARRRPPTLRELSIRTGRPLEGVKDVLVSLAGKGYVEWSRETPEKIKLLKQQADREERGRIDLKYLG